jgi:hypothetical protein
MNKIIKDLFTESDNATFEIESLLLPLIILVFLGLTIAKFCFTLQFNPTEFGGCITAIYGAKAVVTGIKKYSGNGQ